MHMERFNIIKYIHLEWYEGQNDNNWWKSASGQEKSGVSWGDVWHHLQKSQQTICRRWYRTLNGSVLCTVNEIFNIGMLYVVCNY